MADERVDRLERQLEQQGKWTDEKMELVRGFVDEIRTISNRTATILENISRDIASWRDESRGFSDRLREIEGTLNGRHGDQGLVQQVKDLHEAAIAELAARKTHARARGIAAGAWGALTGAIVALGTAWGIFHTK